MKVNIKQKNVFSFLYKAGEIKTQIWNKIIGNVNKKETQNATFRGINKGEVTPIAIKGEPLDLISFKGIETISKISFEKKTQINEVNRKKINAFIIP